MSKLREAVQHSSIFGRTVFFIAFFLSLSLFVAGFFVPPMGNIDGSVLTAAGILLAFAVVGILPELIHGEKDITITHGDTEISISSDKDG